MHDLLLEQNRLDRIKEAREAAERESVRLEQIRLKKLEADT